MNQAVRPKVIVHLRIRPDGSYRISIRIRFTIEADEEDD